MTSSERKLFPAFKEYFSCLVLLAGTNKDNGHLILAKVLEYFTSILLCLLIHVCSPLSSSGDLMSVFAL